MKNLLYLTALLFTMSVSRSFAQTDTTKFGSYSFVIIQQKPEYPEGEQALYKFIKDNLKYPEDAKNQQKQGTVYVGFTIDAEGNIKKIELLRGVFKSLDEEAMRIISLMPKWKPGRNDGKAVDVRFQIPIEFKLK